MQIRSLIAVISLAVPGCVVGEDPVDTVAIAKAKTNSTTVSTTGTIDFNNPFFKSLGTNDRTCASCHVGDQGWTITPAALQVRFEQTGGTDPVFRTNDGSVSPTADVTSVPARRAAYRMLLSKALIRVELPIPAGAEFTLDAVDDPYGHASAAGLSLFRRPMPTTNLRFLTAIMWDAREASLGQQSIDATIGHAQATGTRQPDMDSIVGFESSLYTAISEDDNAGALDKKQGQGGPSNLAGEDFVLGINDALSPGFNPNAFTLFDAWSKDQGKHKADEQARAAIYRGQQIFNTRPIAITGVGGLNDALGRATIQGTCTTCHDTPNVGNHSVKLALNLGLSDESRRTPDMPLYTLRNTRTNQIVKTTDPGRALLTGKWDDIGKFKGPVLRGVALRPPYFHNGSAATLSDVVELYNGRFGLGLSQQEKSDLIAFLGAL